MNMEIDETVFILEYKDSVPPLSRAARNNDFEKMKKLMSAGCLPQTPDNRGWTVVHFCAASNRIEALKIILKVKSKNKKHLVNLTTWENLTPLILAIKAPTPSLKMVRILLTSGASPKLCTNTNLSPLHIACMKKGNLELVKLLIKYGADVNLQEDLSLFTPLHFAVCESKNLNIIKYLISKSDLTLKNINERTAFLEACNLNSLETVELFLKKCKKLANTKTSIPPIVLAGMWGNLKMAKMLINSGADVNFRCKAIVSFDSNASESVLLDADNFLPIHSSLNNLEVFKVLLELTNPTELLKLNTNYCTFPWFVMVYSKDITFYEALLKSDLPDELKVINCSVLINFIVGSPEMISIAEKKFLLLFKYNFYLEPDDVFQNFVCLLSKEELRKSLNFLHFLAQMGISSVDQLMNKNLVFECLTSFSYHSLQETNLMESICTLLKKPVLSLKQMCRITVRRYIRLIAKSDWLALEIVQKSNIPNNLKEFLCFEKL